MFFNSIVQSGGTVSEKKLEIVKVTYFIRTVYASKVLMCETITNDNTKWEENTNPTSQEFS